MKSINLLIGDPGKSNDPFGVLGLRGTYPEKKIFVRHAKQFKREPYRIVAKHFEKLHRQINFDYMILEKNFDYENVSKAFAHLPITYITTSSNLTAETRDKGVSVDKNFMIDWLQKQYKNHTIQVPSVQSVDMQELLNQRNQIVGITGPSGHVSYKAQRNRHDDLFMTELIGCNFIRLWWEELERRND